MNDTKTTRGGAASAAPRAERRAAALISQYIHELSAAERRLRSTHAATAAPGA